MGVVYPHIDIKDTEEASLLQLDATDNTVLVPVPFVQRCFFDESNILGGGANKRYWDDEHESMKAVGAKLYTDAQKFIDEWSWGGGEWNVTIDSMMFVGAEGPIKKIVSWDSPKDDELLYRGNVPYKMTGSTPRYCFDYSLKLTSEKDGDIPIYDVYYTPEKSYLMVIELLKRGLPVLVKPIPVKWDGYAVISQGARPGSVAKAGQLVADDAQGHYHLGQKSTEGNQPINTIVYNRNSNIIFAEHGWYDKIIEEAIDQGAFDDFVDKNLYPIKFITSGAYTNVGPITTYKWGADGFGPEKDDSGNFKREEHVVNSYGKLAELAQKRGDSIAVLELREDVLSVEELKELLAKEDIPDLSVDFEKYKLAAMFTPWCEFSIEKRLPWGKTAKGEKIKRPDFSLFNVSPLTTMPAGFAYLMAYAYSIQTNETWWAAAGVMRGQIPQMVKPLFEIGESFMHLLQGKDANDNANNARYQKIRINPIMNTGSYGYRIWGNRVAAAFRDLGGVYKTLFSEFLNVRMLLCDIKKQIYAAAMRTTFEPNDDITWVSFKVLCSNLLDRMKSGRGLLWYKWHKEVSEERATIKARLTVRPIEAVEAFDITVFLTDQDAEVEE